MGVDKLYLSSTSAYQNNYSAALEVWMDSPTKAYVYETTFALSHVSIFTPSQNTWNSYNLSEYAVALTESINSNSYYFSTYGDSQYSTGLIQYGNILINPNNDVTDLDEDAQQSVLSHEIGHVYGLWHCPEWQATSIMWGVVANDSYTIPKQHDIDDMNAYYS